MSSITVWTVSTEKYTTRSSDLLRRTGELMFSHFRPLIKNSIFESSWSIYVVSLRVAPSVRDERVGLRNSGEKLALIHYFLSEFLERDLCEALC